MQKRCLLITAPSSIDNMLVNWLNVCWPVLNLTEADRVVLPVEGHSNQLLHCHAPFTQSFILFSENSVRLFM